MSRDQISWKCRDLIDPEAPFTSGEVAKLFNVNPRTVARWATGNRLPSFRTLGGHRRYRVADVINLFHKLGLKYPGRSEEDN